MLVPNTRGVEPSSFLVCQASYQFGELKAREKYCLEAIKWDQEENSVNKVLAIQVCQPDIKSSEPM